MAAWATTRGSARLPRRTWASWTGWTQIQMLSGLSNGLVSVTRALGGGAGKWIAFSARRRAGRLPGDRGGCRAGAPRAGRRDRGAAPAGGLSAWVHHGASAGSVDRSGKPRRAARPGTDRVPARGRAARGGMAGRRLARRRRVRVAARLTPRATNCIERQHPAIRIRRALIGKAGLAHGTVVVMATAWSGARCHVGGEDVVRVAVEVLAGPVITHGRTRIGVAGGDLDGAQVHPCVEHGRDEGYLYLILKKAWSVAVSASEARGPREDKERSEEKEPWSWSCRTWLKEWRISVRHDAINPENRRASG